MIKHSVMKNKKTIVFYITVFILLIVMLIILSFNNHYYMDKDILKFLQMQENNNLALKDYLKKNNINSPEGIHFKDTNYFYLLARYYYIHHGLDSWCEYLAKKAFAQSKLFKNEALTLYEKILIKQKKYTLLKKITERYKKNNSLSFFMFTLLTKKDNIDIKNIPFYEFLFPLLYDYLFGEYAVDSNNNIKIMEEYFVSLPRLTFLKKNYKEQVKNILHKVPNNIIFKFVYSYIDKDKSFFLKTLKEWDITNTKFTTIEFVKNMAKGMGLRFTFYKLLKTNLNSLDLDSQYLYVLEALYYEGDNAIKPLMTKLVSSSALTKKRRYILEYFLLHNEKQIDNKWMRNVLNYIAKVKNYQNLYSYREQLLVDLFQKTILFNKTDLLIPMLANIDIENFSTRDKATFYYRAYLIDESNREKWATILSTDYPLSYGNLQIFNEKGKLFNIQADKLKINKNSLSSESTLLYKKAKYYAQFNFFSELYKIKFKDLPEMDKAIIFNELANYFIEKKDYYRGIGYAKRFARSLYGNSLVNIDKDTLKRIFPVHFKEKVFKYSRRYNIDPAFVFAIMREESHFAKEIISYAGAVGLMQIMPSTAKDIATRMKIKNYDLTEPKDNIKMGCFYIDHLRYYFEEQKLILSCYNAGPGNTKKWYNLYKNYPSEILYDLIPVKQTRDYIKKVMRSYYIYKYILKEYKN